MGQNLVLNALDHGFSVAVFNRTAAVTEKFVQQAQRATALLPAYSLQEFVRRLKRPRKIIMMVKAGSAVDDLIDQLLPYLEQGDVIIDGGNSFYHDSERRSAALREKGILFIGTGISGGEEGARHGPSIMPGGNRDAWPLVKDLFTSISAKAADGAPCCAWMGEGGSGHYVKMVHNGIEYGDIQLICEAYQILKELLGYSADEMKELFAKWNRGPLESYLIEITAHILGVKERDGTALVEKVLDVAGAKGTGKWTAISALELDVPVTLIAESVYARSLSLLKEQRLLMAKSYPLSLPSFQGDKKRLAEQLMEALYAAKIMSYAQGFMLLAAASKKYGWGLRFGDIALIWRGGCIIRSKFLYNIKEAFDRNPQLDNLLLDPFFQKEMQAAQESLRSVVSATALHGIAAPCFGAALSFFDGYRCAQLPANLLQAQRDFFGAHTYERVDRPRGEFFHTQW